jgi:hypothetical protein
MHGDVTLGRPTVFGVPFMKFTLTYEGSLPPSANKPKNKEKWAIRQAFHPQLKTYGPAIRDSSKHLRTGIFPNMAEP